MKKLLLLLLAFASLNAVYSQKTSLKLNLKKGETYHQKTTSIMSMAMNTQGFNMDMSIGSFADMSFHVTKARSKYYEMEVRYGYISSSLKMPSAGIDIIMDENSEGPVGEIFKKMQGSSFTVKMSKTGKILEVSGLDEMVDKLLGDTFEGSEAEAHAIKNQITQYFEESSMTQSFNASLIYPSHKVVPGDRWENNIATNIGMAMLDKMNMLYEYEYKGKSDGMNVIAVTGTVSMGMDFDEEEGMSVDMEGTISGEIKADGKTGWVAESSTTNNFAGEITVTTGETDATISVSMDMKAVITDK